MIEFDLNGNILTANDNFLVTMGYDREEVIGKHHRMFVPPIEANSEDYQRFWRRLREGEFISGEFHRVARGGRDVWLQAIYNPVLGLDGKTEKVVKFATDVTAEKVRNADFEGKITAIQRSQAVIEFDLEGKVLDANDAFLDLLGYRLEEVRGRHHRIFVRPEDANTADYQLFWDGWRAGSTTPGSTGGSPRTGTRSGSGPPTTRSWTPRASPSRWSSSPPT